jgi:hypothetical protein
MKKRFRNETENIRNENKNFGNNSFNNFLCLCGPTSSYGGLTSDNVDVIPYQPLETDIITFDISGLAATSPSWIEYDIFSQNETLLQLDLYIDRGLHYTLSNWTYSKQISPLPPEVYNLQVRAFDNYDGTLQDTYNVDFTVVPEPATILLLGIGVFLMART